ncbi:MAG: tRNA adenosine deaminase-associated protein [Longispora sp.]|nr:tRNA adenosine deaminase-associated protein [Longispora sp. (in: high G+C Gram-positive bacteria)]
MSYFAAAAIRNDSGWNIAELDLIGVEDVDDAADRLRDIDEGDLRLLFVEDNDEYLVVLCINEKDDLRVFGSDAAYSEESSLGAALLGDLEPEKPLDLDDELSSDDDDEDERPAADPDSNPIGDADLLSEFGISKERLLAMCTREGMLPSEVTAGICKFLGCVEEFEEFRDRHGINAFP